MALDSRCTRRSFLGTSAKAGAAAAAFPYLIPRSVKAAAGRPAPSNRLNMATIGQGNQGGGDVGAFMSMPDVQFVAACDVRRQVREGTVGRFNGKYGKGSATAYNDFREMFARGDIDMVHIATPDHWHAILSIQAMKSGIDVYCQKPLSLTIGEAWAMHETARRYGRVFQTGSQQRSDNKEFLKVCEYVRSGRIGTIKQVNVNVGGPSQDKLFPTEAVPDGFDWDLWLGPAPWMPYNSERASGNYGGGWRQVRDYSGGMMTDWGAHHFDICQWGLGMDGSGPSEIIPPNQSEERKLVYLYPKTPVGDNVKVVHSGGGNGVLFIGTEGKLECNRGYIKAYPDKILKEPLGAGDVRLYNSVGHYRDFVDCVKSRQRPICDVEVGASSVTVCHLGNIAWWLGRALKWDPAKREILDDAEAARWCDRPKRAPWHL